MYNSTPTHSYSRTSAIRIHTHTNATLIHYKYTDTCSCERDCAYVCTTYERLRCKIRKSCEFLKLRSKKMH